VKALPPLHAPLAAWGVWLIIAIVVNVCRGAVPDFLVGKALTTTKVRTESSEAVSTTKARLAAGENRLSVSYEWLRHSS
tara:strand:+ start:429 stop:665 length:237 start_codon:yes stop_codon:yes gene_type:complete